MTSYLRALIFLVASTFLSGQILADTIPADRLALFDFDPIPAPTELSRVQMLQVAAEAFATQSWRITEVNRSEGYVEAELPVRVHVGRLRITTQEDNFTFEYRESENIIHGWMQKGDKWASRTQSDEGDREAAHRNYILWVEQVYRALGSLLYVHSLSEQ